MRDIGIALLAGLTFGAMSALGYVRRVELLLLDISMMLIVRWARRIYGEDSI